MMLNHRQLLPGTALVRSLRLPCSISIPTSRMLTTYRVTHKKEDGL